MISLSLSRCVEAIPARNIKVWRAMSPYDREPCQVQYVITWENWRELEDAYQEYELGGCGSDWNSAIGSLTRLLDQAKAFQLVGVDSERFIGEQAYFSNFSIFFLLAGDCSYASKKGPARDEWLDIHGKPIPKCDCYSLQASIQVSPPTASTAACPLSFLGRHHGRRGAHLQYVCFGDDAEVRLDEGREGGFGGEGAP